MNSSVVHSSLLHLHERELQRLVREVLSDSSPQWRSTNGAYIQILSIGEWNYGAGPDFLNVALLADGRVMVGNAEFHRYASDWKAHQHDLKHEYHGLLLHIVLHNNTSEEFADYTLVVDEQALNKQARNKQARNKQIYTMNNSASLSTASVFPQNLEAPLLDETLLQEALVLYATRRIERKRNEALSTLNPYQPHQAFLHLTEQFFHRRNASSRRRPQQRNQAERILERLRCGLDYCSQHCRTQHQPTFYGNTTTTLPPHPFVAFIMEFSDCPISQISERLQSLLHTTIANEGVGTRQEILINVLLPICFALCQQRKRFPKTCTIARAQEDELWKWLFSLPARARYAGLARRFPDIPQHCVYEQQGLLEYYAELSTAQSLSCGNIHTSHAVMTPGSSARGLRAQALHATAEYILRVYSAL